MSTVACPYGHGENPEFSAECPRCGAAVSDLASEPSRNPAESRGYCADAIAAFLLAIAALLIWPLAILAVVYGLAALRTIREEDDDRRPRSKGYWLAAIAVAFSVVVIPLVAYGVVVV
jgi:uncharacterized paraquat-inducible protein A